MKRLLIIDDDEVLRETINEYFSLKKFEVAEASDYKSALEVFEVFNPDIIFLDLDLVGDGNDTTGHDILREIRSTYDKEILPVIVVSGTGDTRIMQKVLEDGANDYEIKPFKLMELVTKANRILEKKVKVSIEDHTYVDTIIGQSKKIMEVTKKIWESAQLGSDLLILGESGTGKDLAARYYNKNCIKKEKPFVIFDCTLRDLFEDRLFGHSKGAFNNAIADKPGLAEKAQGGILFFDEIGELSEEQQATLLLLLDGMPFRRLGSNVDIKPDFIILAATNRDLKDMVNQKTFRFDLLQRLIKQVVTIPALRERKEDVPLLVEEFIKKFNPKYNKAVKNVEPQLMDKLMTCQWFGNIRELEYCVEVGVMNAINQTIHEEDLRGRLNQTSNDQTPEAINNNDVPYKVFKAKVENIKSETYKKYFEYHLQKNDWNKSRTAVSIGIKREYLRHLLMPYDFDKK